MTLDRAKSRLRETAMFTLYGTIGLILSGFLCNYFFNTSYSPWALATFGVSLGIWMFIFRTIEERLGLKWFPDRSEYKRRLAELQEERDRLAQSETETH